MHATVIPQSMKLAVNILKKYNIHEYHYVYLLTCKKIKIKNKISIYMNEVVLIHLIGSENKLFKKVQP